MSQNGGRGIGACLVCGKRSKLVSSQLGVCVDCLRSRRGSLQLAMAAHKRLRASLGHSPDPSKPEKAVVCPACGRGCRLGDGEVGFCELRANASGTLRHLLGFDEFLGVIYYDPHPTNCVAIEVCPAGSGSGYPRFALREGPEYGYYNIAVFLGSCNLSCLFCQNWEHHENSIKKRPRFTTGDLLEAVNERTTCVCFFGGDPGCFAVSLIPAARKMVERARSRGLRVFRVCWETNGLWNPSLFVKAAELSLETGGVVKVDFKAWTPEVFSALTGAPPEAVEVVKRNLEAAAKMFKARPEPPLLVVSTLLVPGYVDSYEVDMLTKFVAKLDPRIPYVFLAFHPDFYMRDLPRTSKRHAEEAVKIAKENGLERVIVGNAFLLGGDY